MSTRAIGWRIAAAIFLLFGLSVALGMGIAFVPEMYKAELENSIQSVLDGYECVPKEAGE